MKACGVEGTNQGLVAFTSQYIHYICRFTLKEQMMEFVIALSRTVLLLLTDELAEQRPDMDIKVTAFTVSEKSINMSQVHVKIFILKALREISRSTFSVVFRFCHLYSRMDWPNSANNILSVDVICTFELFIKVYPFVLYIMYV